MYLILLEKDGKEQAYSVMHETPTENMLRQRLQDIANEKESVVIARSHPIFGLKEIRVEPEGDE